MTTRDLGFEVRYARCTDDELAAFEAKLGSTLPEQYRRYLLEDGGGWAPRLRFFPVAWPEGYTGPEGERPEWLALLGFHRGVGANDPESVVGLWDALCHREPDDFGLPKDALSIASTATFHIVLGIAGDRAGQVGVVYLNERPANPDWTSIAIIAAGFDDWLDSLVDETGVPEEYRDL